MDVFMVNVAVMDFILSYRDGMCVSARRLSVFVHLGAPNTVLSASFCMASRIVASLAEMVRSTGLA